MKKVIYATTAALFFAGSYVHANWVCNVNNAENHQYTVSAPKEDDAEKMGNAVCKSYGIKEKDCTPDCFDTGVTAHRWHCSVQNAKRETWSITTPKKEKATAIAMNLCKEHGIASTKCKPLCVPE